MLNHGDFSPRDWDLAPQYTSPVSTPGVLVLDFDILHQMARQEEANGAFRQTPDGTLAQAPILVDDLPGAFYSINTSYPDFTPERESSAQETIVVMRGLLKVAFAEQDSDDDAATSNNIPPDRVYAGQSIDLREQRIALQAIGAVDPASCLALALYRDGDVVIRLAA